MTTLVQAKPFWMSRVLWFNALAIAALVLTELSSSAELPQAVARWTGVALGAVNIVLRTMTNQPVSASSDSLEEVP